MMPIIRRARPRGDNRGHRNFGIVIDGMRMAGFAMNRACVRHVDLLDAGVDYRPPVAATIEEIAAREPTERYLSGPLAGRPSPRLYPIATTPLQCSWQCWMSGDIARWAKRCLSFTKDRKGGWSILGNAGSRCGLVPSTTERTVVRTDGRWHRVQ